MSKDCKTGEAHIFSLAVLEKRFKARSCMDSEETATHKGCQANALRAAKPPEISGTFSVHIGKMDELIDWHRSKMLKRWIQFFTELPL